MSFSVAVYHITYFWRYWNNIGKAVIWVKLRTIKNMALMTPGM